MNIIHETFWLKVNKTDTCWLWKASKNGDGYGTTWYRGQPYSSHRLSWELSNGKVPKNLYVLHKCDVPSCVNPGHLFLGTQSDNVRDMMEKGRNRQVSGTKCHTSKLTPKQVAWVKTMYPRWTQRKIADYLGVVHSTIWFILHGRSWKKEVKNAEL